MIPEYAVLRTAQWAELAQSNPDHLGWLQARDALYLYGTIGLEAVLRPDGSVWVDVCDAWPESDETTWRPATESERLGALVIASARMPALAALLPPRPVTTPDCADCAGRGRRTEWGDVLCPTCCGLGWAPVAAT